MAVRIAVRDNQGSLRSLSTVAHELAHSIDPCGIFFGPSDYAIAFDEALPLEDQFPIPGVLRCLRSEQSDGAKKIVPLPKSYLGGGGYGSESEGSYGSVSPAQSSASRCESDQIGEAFSDWMAAEILPDYIHENYPKLTTEQLRTGYSNVFRFSCNTSASGLMEDVHPALKKRVDYLLLMQPTIRADLGCQASAPKRVYCKVGAPPPEEPVKGQPNLNMGYPNNYPAPTYPGPQYPNSPQPGVSK